MGGQGVVLRASFALAAFPRLPSHTSAAALEQALADRSPRSRCGAHEPGNGAARGQPDNGLRGIALSRYGKDWRWLLDAGGAGGRGAADSLA